jgi:hypothetical protein
VLDIDERWKHSGLSTTRGLVRAILMVTKLNLCLKLEILREDLAHRLSSALC